MRHDEPDESYRPDEGQDARGEERCGEENRQLESVRGEAQLLQRFLPERHQIQLSRASHDERESDGRQEREQPEGARRYRGQVAEKPVDDTAEPVEVE